MTKVISQISHSFKYVGNINWQMEKRGYSEGEVIMTELESTWSSIIQDTLIENPKNDLIPSLYKDVNRKQSLCLHYNRYSEITQSEKKSFDLIHVKIGSFITSGVRSCQILFNYLFKKWPGILSPSNNLFLSIFSHNLCNTTCLQVVLYI